MFHLPRPFDALPPPNGCIAAYQRFTLPRRERVIVSDRTPRRNTTLVLDTAQGIPVGANTTTGFDTSRDTPCPDPAIDTERISGDHQPAPAALHDRGAAGHRDGGGDALGGRVDRDPVPQPLQAGECDRCHNGQNRQHNREFDECEASAHGPN